jgi:hypothetical protein
MMIGGIVWITAGGNQTRIGEAKAWIGASLSGLVLALTAYTILAAVSPALVSFKPLPLVSPNKQTLNSDYSGLNLENEKTVRGALSSSGIQINNSACTYAGEEGCTNVANLPMQAVVGLVNIAADLDKISDRKIKGLMVTGGTETTGHKSHGPNIPNVDLRVCQSPCTANSTDKYLIDYMQRKVGNNLTYDTYYTAQDGSFRTKLEKNNDGSQHFHVEFLK